MPKFSIKYAPEALQEIKQIVEYYNRLSAGLGNRFNQQLLAAIKALKNNPHYNSFRYDEVRLAVVDKFPYANILNLMSSNFGFEFIRYAA